MKIEITQTENTADWNDPEFDVMVDGVYKGTFSLLDLEEKRRITF